MIPVRQRDTRMVGCTGDSQVVISNPDLEDLIVSVLEAVDSPVDVRTLRSLVMSRLPVMDIYLVPLDGDDSDNENGNATSLWTNARTRKRGYYGVNQSAKRLALLTSFCRICTKR